jgi:hypothetical protein
VPPPPGRKRGGLLSAAGIVALLVVAAGGWLWQSLPSHPIGEPPASSAAPAAPTPALPIEIATEQQIRDHTPTGLTIFRLAENPRILVLDFASLRDQGHMLNRVAALVEKVGLPRDRVLNDSELDQAIRAQGGTIETFYYGHDYSARSLVRFFALADRDGIEINPEEATLRALLRQEDLFSIGTNAALISLAAVGADTRITPPARAAILRHELSHGEFFSAPAYADYVRDFWLTVLTAGERAAFRSFLASEEYDAGQEELMYNEMQAYLMFTRDAQFFTPAKAGLSVARLTELRTRFSDGMPHGWLRSILVDHQEPSSGR